MSVGEKKMLRELTRDEVSYVAGGEFGQGIDTALGVDPNATPYDGSGTVNMFRDGTYQGTTVGFNNTPGGLMTTVSYENGAQSKSIKTDGGWTYTEVTAPDGTQTSFSISPEGAITFSSGSSGNSGGGGGNGETGEGVGGH